MPNTPSPPPPSDSKSYLQLCLNHCHNEDLQLLKFIYSEKAAKFCETSTLLLSYVVTDKSKVEISQNVLAFLEYMNMVAKSDWQGTMTIFHWNFLIKPELELERERNFGTS